MNKAKRILSFALCLVMVLTLMPFAAFADGTHSVTVKYVYADGLNVSGQVYESWVATYSDGSAVNETVSLPQAAGYTPVGDPSVSGEMNAQFNADNTALELSSAGITEDVVITVTYTAAKNVYEVQYYQQHVNDEGYDLVETVTVNDKYTEDKVEVADKGYTGFYMLPYDEDVTVAADGTTVIKVYYDRNYYLVTFDYAGGFDGPDPIYARYGSAIDKSSITAPTKPGYTFNGWDDLPETVPAGGAKATAKWALTSETAKVTYVIWGENANDKDYSYLMSYNEFRKIGTQATFTMSSDGSYIVCGKDEHTHTGVTGSCYALNCDKVHTHTSACGLNCKHVHTAACYGATGNGSTTVPGDWWDSKNDNKNFMNDLGLESGYVYHYEDNKLGGKSHYIFYFNSKYYDLTDSQYNAMKTGNAVKTGSFKGSGFMAQTDDYYKYATKLVSCTHPTHDDSCYNCGIPAHTHSNSCYKLICGKEAHTHTAACKKSLDTSLYNFVKADNVTVAADGSSVVNVYLDRKDYTITFKDGNSTIKTVTRKWGQSLADIWPIVGTNKTYNNGERWKPSGSSRYKEVLVYIDIMPSESFTLTVNTSSETTRTMNYNVEVLSGESGTTYSGKTFKLYKSVSAKYGYITEAEDFIDLTGFTKLTSNPKFSGGQSSATKMDFYYTRNSYSLIFNNGIDNVATFTVPYEKPLKDVSGAKNVVPTRPANISSQYEFAGWYLNPAGTGDKVDLNTTAMKMPADNLVLYAKWVPKTYTVTFANTKAETAGSLGTINEGYNTYIDSSEYNTIRNKAGNGSRTFIGWFYMENGVEKAFDPTSMPVTKNMDLYAKWSSTAVLPYNVYFKLEDGTEIGEAISGKALEDSTRTFDAKIGNELYSDYQTGYYPEVNSHSIVISDGQSNDFTFYYVHKDEVNYTVEYRNAQTGELMPGVETKHSSTTSAVVTENYVPIKGYIPDAAQKTLILTANDADNVIVFYYTENLDSAMVSINHYLMQGADHSKKVTAETSERPGKVNDTVTANAKTYAGYTFDRAEVIVGSNTENAGASVSKTLTNDGIIINFYYNENVAKYNYTVVGNGGTVNGKSSATENVPAMTGRAAGATADFLEGYRIVGWFDDEACTTPATNCSISGNKLTPNKVDGVYSSHNYFVKVVESSLYNRNIVVDYGLPFSFDVSDYEIGGLGVTAPVALIKGTTANNTCTAKSVGLNYGKAEVSDTSIIYTPAKFVNGIDKFVYSVKDGSDYRFAQVNVIPATTVYYEDSIGSINYTNGKVNGAEATSGSGAWSTDGNDKSKDAIQSLANELYGNDAAYDNCNTYSMGSVHKVTVSAINNPNTKFSKTEKPGAWPTASFSFRGTGFDVISLTNTDTGLIKVKVEGKAANGETVTKNLVVNEYYGYTCSKDKEHPYLVYIWEYVDEGWGWHIMHHEKASAELNNAIPATKDELDAYIVEYGSTRPEKPQKGDKFVAYENNYNWTVAEKADPLYQIPTMKVDDLPYGDYTVTITPTYGSNYDMNTDGHYSFSLDAIRVYGTLKNNVAYVEANEAAPEFYNVRSYLLDQATYNRDSKENPVGIAFIDGINDNGTIDDYDSYGPNNEVYLKPGKAIAFAINKSANIASVQVGFKAINGEATVDVNGKKFTTSSATDMYRDITKYIDADGVVTITNSGENLVSITTLKITHSASSVSAAPRVNDGVVTQAKAMVRSVMLASAPVEKTPFEPSVSINVADSATVGDEITVKVSTSEDVAFITVNGEKVEVHDADYVWTYTTTAEAEGEMGIEVVAYNYDGEAADAVQTASITVEAAPVVPDEPEEPEQHVSVITKIINAVKSFFGKLFGR